MEQEELTGKIIGCAMTVHTALGAGFLESVYQNALKYELRKAGLRVDSERPIIVYYDSLPVGVFEADLLVEGCIIIELKAVQAFSAAHEVQLVNYLTATGIEIDLLLNFGTTKLEFKRKHRTFRKREMPAQSDQNREDDQD